MRRTVQSDTYYLHCDWPDCHEEVRGNHLITPDDWVFVKVGPSELPGPHVHLCPSHVNKADACRAAALVGDILQTRRATGVA